MVSRRLSVYSEERYLSMLEILRGADVAFTNLEGLMHNFEGYPMRERDDSYTWSPPWTAEELRWMGFKMVSIANNHTMDYSHESLLAGLRALDGAGIVHSGSGMDLAEARQPAYLETERGRIALVSVYNCLSPREMAAYPAPGVRGRPGVNGIWTTTTYVVDRKTFEELRRISQILKSPPTAEWRARYSSREDIPLREPEGDELMFLNKRFRVGEKPGIQQNPVKPDVEANLREVRGARREADWVLVSYHMHESAMEDSRLPAPFARKFAQDCIECGADAVLGHGYHENRGIEIYRGRPIFYSLGTFVNHMDAVLRYPYDAYEKLGLHPSSNTGADVMAAKSRWRVDFPHPWWFKSVIASFTLRGGGLTELKLHPVDLGFEQPISERGRPMLARGEVAREIIERYSRLSAVFGTEIEFGDGLGIVKV